MKENLFGTRIRLYESITICRIERFNSSSSHVIEP
jgi:hypothetical protein